MNNTLYQINQDVYKLLEEINNSDGEITEEQAQALSIKESELVEKAESYLAVIRSNEAFVDQIDQELKRLNALKKSRKNLNERLKTNLLTAVELFGEFSVGTNTFKTRKSTVVEVDDVNQLPDRYKTLKVTETADKVEIKRALSKGDYIEGCRLIEKNNLSIK